MKLSFLVAAAAITAGTALVTDYKKEKRFHVEHESRYTIEVTELEMEVDGERQETGDLPLQKQEVRTRLVQRDEVQAVEDGHPTHVRRHYETAKSHKVITDGTEERTEENESPFEGLNLDLTLDGDEVRLEVVDGETPDHDGALDGHRLELCLDALLPKPKVEENESWELDNESVRRALGLELRGVLFPQKVDADPDAREGGGRGRRGARDSSGAMFRLSEWTGTATLASLTEDVDGVECAKIALELKAEGSLPEPAPGEGRRSRMPLYPGEASPLLENTYSIELEGALYFAIEPRRPLRLELEGKLEIEATREMARPEHTIRIRTRIEGEVVVRVEVREGKAEEK